MPQLPEAKKVDRLVRQLESRRIRRARPRSLLRPRSEHSRDCSDRSHPSSIMRRIIWLTISSSCFASSDSGFSSQLSRISCGICPSSTSFSTIASAQRSDGRPAYGIAPGIVGKPTLKKELRQLVEKIFEVQAVEQRASPFGVLRDRHD